jgi:hypothetical protein
MSCYCNAKRYDESVVLFLKTQYLKEINWTVFPNPTSDVITIQISSLDFSELYNSLGQRILISKSPDISLSNLKAGLYFVKVFDKSGREFTKKIIKK